jgi:ABC-type hemin transport system substrate-binding protein
MECRVPDLFGDPVWTLARGRGAGWQTAQQGKNELSYPPERIVCLTEETVEALYLLGRDSLIAGVTGYAVRPARVRKEKPRVAAFTSAHTDKILALKPDLVLAFSDLQADIVADLIRHGIAVHCFNQRSVEGIFDMVETLGRDGGCARRGGSSGVRVAEQDCGMAGGCAFAPATGLL